jgi:hypothetical protein
MTSSAAPASEIEASESEEVSGSQPGSDQEEESENEDRLTLEQVKAKKAAHARFVRFRRSFKRSLQQLVHIDNNNISNIFELWDARCMQ